MAGSNALNIVATFNGQKAFEGINRLERSFTRLRRIVMTVIAGKVVKEMANFGNQMSLMSERTGMSISRLSALRNAFVASGAGAKSFEKTISNINEGLLGLSLGRGEFAAKLGMFGISPYTKTGALKTADQVMYDIADWAAKQKGRMSRKDILYRLTSIFGIDDATAVKMLAGGAAMRGSAYSASQRMGIITDEQANKLDNLKKKFDEFFGTIHNTFARVVAEIEPYLTPILVKLQELVKAAGDNPKTTAAIAAIVGGFTAIITTGNLLVGVLGTLSTALGGLFFVIEAALGGVLGWFIGKGAAWLVNWMFGGDTEKRSEIMNKYIKGGKIGKNGMIEGNPTLDMDAMKNAYEKLYSKGYGNRTKEEEEEFNALRSMIASVDPTYLTGKAELLALPEQPNIAQSTNGTKVGDLTINKTANIDARGMTKEELVWATEEILDSDDYEKPVYPYNRVVQEIQGG